MSKETQQLIHEQVTSHPVVLYMKGDQKLPQCGFSANAVRILKALGVAELFTDMLYRFVISSSTPVVVGVVTVFAKTE